LLVNKRIQEFVLNALTIEIKNPDPRLIDLLRQVFPDAHVQVINANYVAGPRHLCAAIENAIAAVKGGYALAKRIEMEILLAITGMRSVNNAIRTAGIKREVHRYVMVLLTKVPIRKQIVLERLARLQIEVLEEIKPLSFENAVRIARILKLSDNLLSSYTTASSFEEAVERACIERASALYTRVSTAPIVRKRRE